MIFQPPESEFIFAGGDLETLYLEEIDVSDSNDYHCRMKNEERNSLTPGANDHTQDDVKNSGHSIPPEIFTSPDEGSNTSIEVLGHWQQLGTL